MFGLLRYDGKANGKQPERRKSASLNMGEFKTKSQQTPVKSFAMRLVKKLHGHWFPYYNVVTQVTCQRFNDALK